MRQNRYHCLMMKHILTTGLYVTVAMLSMTACSSTRTIHGAYADNNAPLSGQAHHTSDPVKQITLLMPDNVRCQGVYQYDALSSTAGFGHVACDKKPPFDFTFITAQNTIMARGIDGMGRAFLFQFKP
jgi:hypothetical protein